MVTSPGDPREVAAMGDGVRTRDCACRRTRNAGGQRSLGAGARPIATRGADPRAAAGYRHQRDNLSARPAGPQRHLRGADRSAHDIALILGCDRLARRRGREKHHRRAGRARRSHHHRAQQRRRQHDPRAWRARRRLLDRLEEAAPRHARGARRQRAPHHQPQLQDGHVHDEFVDLADRVHEMLNERMTASHPNSRASSTSSTAFPTAPNRCTTP